MKKSLLVLVCLPVVVGIIVYSGMRRYEFDQDAPAVGSESEVHTGESLAAAPPVAGDEFGTSGSRSSQDAVGPDSSIRSLERLTWSEDNLKVVTAIEALGNSAEGASVRADVLLSFIDRVVSKMRLDTSLNEQQSDVESATVYWHERQLTEALIGLKRLACFPKHARRTFQNLLTVDVAWPLVLDLLTEQGSEGFWPVLDALRVNLNDETRSRCLIAMGALHQTLAITEIQFKVLIGVVLRLDDDAASMALGEFRDDDSCEDAFVGIIGGSDDRVACIAMRAGIGTHRKNVALAVIRRIDSGPRRVRAKAIESVLESLERPSRNAMHLLVAEIAEVADRPSRDPLDELRLECAGLIRTVRDLPRETADPLQDAIPIRTRR